MTGGTEPAPSVSGETNQRGRFFASALTDEEKLDLTEAEQMEGLEQEIAVLRVRLKSALSQKPPDFALVLRGFDLLMKAISAQHRLSPSAGKDFAASLEAAIKGVEHLILPPDP